MCIVWFNAYTIQYTFVEVCVYAREHKGSNGLELLKKCTFITLLNK